MRISDWSSDVCSSDLVICLVAEIGPALRGDPDAVDIDDIQRIISDPRSIGNVERIILSPQESVRAEIKFLCAAMGGDAFGHDGPEPEIGRAHVCTTVTNAHLVCRLLLEKKNTINIIQQHQYQQE